MVLNITPQEKSGGVRSDLAGYVMYGDPFPIQIAGNCSYKNVRTMLERVCSDNLLSTPIFFPVGVC